MKTENATKKGNSSRIRPGLLSYRRTPIEIESPEQFGYQNIRYNLTESSAPDMVYANLDMTLEDSVLAYTSHTGAPELRKRIAGNQVEKDNVLVTAGAAAALFIAATSLIKPEDHIIILHPNYVTNIETPRAMGCHPDYLRLSFERQFKIDLEELEQLIKPDTRLISITYPHNPTGMTLTESELKQIISLAESQECYLLVDETYRDMSFSTPPPYAAALSPNAISISSMSKSYGLPGIRIGWLLTRDEALLETFLAAKEQIFICNSVVDEKIAEYFLSKKEEFFPTIKKHIRENFETVKSWIEPNEWLEWAEPTGGCVCFPKISSAQVDVEKFYTILNHKYKTYVGPGHWFEMERQYMRIGYGWPSNEELQGGLLCITKALEEANP